jgi:hypothetical protein
LSISVEGCVDIDWLLMRWAIQDLNLRPLPYQRSTLTNGANRLISLIQTIEPTREPGPHDYDEWYHDLCRIVPLHQNRFAKNGVKPRIQHCN